jgi:protein-S-isoprenylcysteine O-methyltransferase Ste14
MISSELNSEFDSYRERVEMVLPLIGHVFTSSMS